MATIRHSSKRSNRVILTAAAAVGMAAQAQAADPCDASTFNGKACTAAVKQQGFCSGGAWVSTTYSQRYPYYYDAWTAYASAGGAVTPFVAEKCAVPRNVQRGGFGSTGVLLASGG
jgi:hypothetical protein